MTYQDNDTHSYVKLNEMIGIISPEARGCGDSMTTNQQLLTRPISSIYDSSLDNGRCYQKKDIVYDKAETGHKPQLKSNSMEVAPMDIVKDSESMPTGVPAKGIVTPQKDCGCGCGGAGTCFKSQEKKLLFLLAAIVAVVIIIKIWKK